MPYQCQRCNYRSDTEETCPKCGSRMTFTILGGVEIEEKKKSTVKVAGQGPPGLFQRIGQCLAGLIWAHILASMLVTAFVYILDSRGIKPEQIREQAGGMLGAATVVIPCIAIAGAASISLRGVYLAQQVGLVVGLLAGLAFVGEQYFFQLQPAWWQWPTIPVIGAVIGFVFGLRVAGKLEVVEDIEYQPIDSWDRDVKPKVLYVEPAAPEKWLRVIRAIGFAIVFHLLWWGAYILLRWVHVVGEPRLTDAMRDTNLGYGEILAFILGGIYAGSRTKSGISQGTRFGLGMVLYHVLVTSFSADPLPAQMIGTITIAFVFFGVLAGLFGSFAAPATKHFVNRQES